MLSGAQMEEINLVQLNIGRSKKWGQGTLCGREFHECQCFWKLLERQRVRLWWTVLGHGHPLWWWLGAHEVLQCISREWVEAVRCLYLCLALAPTGCCLLYPALRCPGFLLCPPWLRKRGRWGNWASYGLWIISPKQGLKGRSGAAVYSWLWEVPSGAFQPLRVLRRYRVGRALTGIPHWAPYPKCPKWPRENGIAPFTATLEQDARERRWQISACLYQFICHYAAHAVLWIALPLTFVLLTATHPS